MRRNQKLTKVIAGRTIKVVFLTTQKASDGFEGPIYLCVSHPKPDLRFLVRSTHVSGNRSRVGVPLRQSR